MQRKKEKAEKVRDLSQAIRQQNMAASNARSTSPACLPRPQPQQEPKYPSARERAQEYARSGTTICCMHLLTDTVAFADVPSKAWQARPAVSMPSGGREHSTIFALTREA